MQTDPVDARLDLVLFDQHGDDIFVKGRRYGRPLGDVLFTVGMSAFKTLLLRHTLWDINAQPTMFSRASMQHRKNMDFITFRNIQKIWFRISTHPAVRASSR